MKRLEHKEHVTFHLNNPLNKGNTFVYYPGFPTRAENMEGALQNLMGERSYVNTWEVHVGGLKTVLKNTCEGVHLLVKFPALSRQAYKFTKNELLHMNFSMILARF